MNKIILDFTTTACNRPEILDITYNSFTNNLKNVDFKNSTLYINIDPSPNNNNIMDIIKVAKKYFGNVVYNIPDKPNFTEAVLWCFKQVKTDYFFHLEDDWLLLHPIDIIDVIYNLYKNDNLLQCILNTKSNHEPFEPAFIPSLFRKKIVDFYTLNMNNIINPELQMKLIFRNNLYGIQKYKSIQYRPGIALSKDIGRQWLKKNGLKRDYTTNKSSWATWMNE